MSEKRKNIIFYVLAGLIGLMAVHWVKTAQDDMMKILLYPHTAAVMLFYNIPMIYHEGVGYVSIDYTFAIGSACMGSHFMLMLFGMNVCMFVKYFKGFYKGAWFAISFMGAIFIGILMSIIRIISSLPFVAYEKFALVHVGIGVMVYFFALLMCYITAKKLVGRNET